MPARPAANIWPLDIQIARKINVVTPEMIDKALNAWFASPPSESDQGLARSMRAALEAALKGWQPIKTAPMDGTIMDVWCPEDTPQGGYRVPDSYWSTVDQIWRRIGGASETTWMHQPTHWMPIPDAPSP